MLFSLKGSAAGRLLRRIGALALLRAPGAGRQGLGGRTPCDRRHLFIRLGHPGRAEAMGFKRDANLPLLGFWMFSTSHDSLLTPMAPGWDWAFGPEAGRPELPRHSWGVVGIVVWLSRTLSVVLPLCWKCNGGSFACEGVKEIGILGGRQLGATVSQWGMRRMRHGLEWVKGTDDEGQVWERLTAWK